MEFTPASFTAAVPFGLLIDPNGDVVAVGRALERLVRPTLPMAVDELFRVKLPARIDSALEALQRGRQPLALILNGTKIRLRGEVVALKDDGGLAFMANPIAATIDEVNAAGIQLQDFSAGDSTLDLLWSMQATHTALRDAEALSQRLKEAADAANAAAEAKSRFLAVMSHEIRTPMNGLGSMVDLLHQTDLSSEQLDLIRTIDDCASTLHTIVDDILDFSKLQDGATKIEWIPHRPAEIVDRVERIFRTAAASTDVVLGIKVHPDCEGWHLGDPARIQQILSNLVSNAIKFSANGCVVLSLEAGTQGRMIMQVRDTGMGIPTEAQATLFDPFTQADESTSRRFGGTGLGLSIARSLAEAMGGELSLLESSFAGSTFQLTLPLRAIEAPDHQKDEAGAGDNPGTPAGGGSHRPVDRVLSVLVVDDNPTNRLVADRLLRKLGAEVATANDGSEAVEAIEGTEYDLVLMDLMMPGLSGIDATKAIRSLSVEWSDLPIVAFSAGVMEDQVKDAKDAGMGDFLEKPVRLRELEALLARYR